MKKFLVFFFSLLCFINPLNAVSSNEVDYDIVDYIVDAKLDISGNMTIKEVIAVEGTYNGYIRDLVYKNDNLKGFNKEDIDFSNSSIYNANVSNINNVEIVGNNLVKLYLNAEEMFFEYNLTFPIISSSLFAEEDIRNSDKNNFPIGTGRYKLKAINTSSQMELEENNNWWNKSTESLRINTITIRIYETIAEVYNGYKLRAD